MRLYAPKSEALTGKWNPPPVMKGSQPGSGAGALSLAAGALAQLARVWGPKRATASGNAEICCRLL